MKLHRGIGALLGTLLLGTAGLAQADAFVGVLPTTPGGTNYQAYYDSTTNLTWLANADMNGGTWWAANTWASGLDINGVTGWTLPTTTQPDSSCGGQFNPGGGLPNQGYGFNCTGSQMGNLFYNGLGGSAGNSIVSTHNSNYGLFSNVQSYYYWSATEYAPNTGGAWGFNFGAGYQDGGGYKTDDLYAWAVHSGDAGAPPATGVPEPGEFGLMGMAMAAAGFAARRRLALR